MLRYSALLLVLGCASSQMPSTTSAPDAGSAGVRIPAAGAVWPDEGPATWPARPTHTEITANDLRSRLYAFAHDSMEGRRIGEPGNYKGTAWIAAEFARLGLKPAGENGTYFQDLPFGPIGIEAASASLTSGGSALSVRSDWVPISPSMGGGLGGSAEFGDAQTVFAGRWGDSTALDPALFRGKIAVFLASDASPGAELPPRPAPVLTRCDSLPDMFGAAAAAQVEAERRAGRLPTPPRGAFGPQVTRDGRAQTAGAAGVLVIADGSHFAHRCVASLRRADDDAADGAAVERATSAARSWRPASPIAFSAARRRRSPSGRPGSR